VREFIGEGPGWIQEPSTLQSGYHPPSGSPEGGVSISLSDVSPVPELISREVDLLKHELRFIKYRPKKLRSRKNVRSPSAPVVEERDDEVPAGSDVEDVGAESVLA
jgi:hypothetical protein